MKLRNLLTLALAVAFLLIAPITAEAAEYQGQWKEDSNGWWFEYVDENGQTTYAKDEFWMIGGVEYYFDETGYMVTGWEWADNFGWIYAEESGALVKNTWKLIDGEWYYFFEDASIAIADGYNYYDVAEYEINGQRYLFTASGAMVSGWYNSASANSTYGEWWYCNADGTVYDGWLYDGGEWYYIEDGNCVQNTYTDIDGVYYRFDRSGAMVDGWYEHSYSATDYSWTEWYYSNGNGSITEQWVQSGNDWYYVDDYGSVLTSGVWSIIPENIEEPTYDYGEETYEQYLAELKPYSWVFDANGKLSYGWMSVTTSNGTTWYHSDAEGHPTTGWVESNGKWYYIEDGVMMTNFTTPDGCYVDNNGVWVR